jgi:glycosyltransferase involved in cell wall biosynthesis
MRIGFDAKRLYCNFTGLGNYSRTLLRNLAEFYPDEVYYLYTTRMDPSPETARFVEDPAFLTYLPDVRLKSWWRTFRIKDRLKTDRLDVYHGLSHEIPVNLDKTRINGVVTIHDLIFRIHPDTYATIDRRIYDFKSRYACRHADRIIAISQGTKEDIVNHYQVDPAKIDVVYQACNPAYYRLKHQPEIDRVAAHYKLPPDYLLSVGSVEPRKNLKKVLEAMTWMKRDLLIPLVVVGRGGKYRQEAMELAQKSGLGKFVVWIDHLSATEHLQAIYQNAHALVYPSLYEGFGLPVAEALLSKTPVITSDRTALREAGGPFSLYVNPKESEEIAGAIEKVLTDNNLRQNMIHTGYLYAHQTFAPDKVTRGVMESYLRAIGGKQ